MRLDDLYVLYTKPTGSTAGRWSRRGGYFTQAAAELEITRFRPAFDITIVHERQEVVFSTLKPTDTRPATGIP